jgi:rubrerythrin
MPVFGDPFSGMLAERKMSALELVRAIRLMVAAEYEAVQMYTQLAESTDNALARVALMKISDEELVHAGEFLKLLQILAPDEAYHYEKGYKEVEDMLKRLQEQS